MRYSREADCSGVITNAAWPFDLLFSDQSRCAEAVSTWVVSCGFIFEGVGIV